jgi:hypothetical protein
MTNQNPFDPALHGGVMFHHPEISDVHERPRRKLDPAQAGYQKHVYQPCFGCGGGNSYPVQKAPLGPFLPPPYSAEPLAMEVHTLRWGTADWLAECAPSLEDWCRRHGHALRVWGRHEVPTAYPNEKFILVDLLREFVARGSAARFLWIDADVWCHPM